MKGWNRDHKSSAERQTWNEPYAAIRCHAARRDANELEARAARILELEAMLDETPAPPPISWSEAYAEVKKMSKVAEYEAFVNACEVALECMDQADAEIAKWGKWSAVPAKLAALIVEISADIEGARRELDDELEARQTRNEWEELRARFPRQLCAGDL